MEPNKRGDAAELRACAWLLGHGYEVFRNVSSTGLIDIVAFKRGDIWLLDVKSWANGGGAVTAEQGALGIVPLIEKDGQFRVDGREAPALVTARRLRRTKEDVLLDRIEKGKTHWIVDAANR